ncbi:MAG: DUF285 domain-containing protein [Lachnospiraceae bacterium]|nr:DUF285 domain-containing protein [Lachnospiraceae bacterium]
MVTININELARNIDTFASVMNEKELKVVGKAPSDCGMLFYKSNCEVLDLTELDTSDTEDMFYFFASCCYLKEIRGLENLDVSKVANMSYTFQGCENLKTLDLSNWKTDKLNNIQSCFNSCSNLKEIKGLNNLNVLNVTNMSYMFYNCHNIETLDISNWQTNNLSDIQSIFKDCRNLKEIKGLNNLNVSKVQNMDYMFSDCNNIKTTDLTGWQTDNLRSMENAFNWCINLKEIKGLENLNVSKIKNMSGLFQFCFNLENVDISNWKLNSFSDMRYMFKNCTRLKEIKGLNISKLLDKNIILLNMFENCPMKEQIDFMLEEDIKTTDTESNKEETDIYFDIDLD